ncbi:hypothetical protein AS850_06445 [Frondihabitans sp. 762G35]|uniref:DoxX family protein n=1 Tax=Frondihabitans sp. 762G35 TaxID=1446794 RepID=UPI000D229364|nr:hypothetical protein [Frondihabitans sp. 762G35]ARC56713.1 hypothetical protein AS850_06445 [Frondihabitans sp. 762G35]
MTTASKQTLTLVGMTSALALSGTLHLVRPRTFDGIVPSILPGRARTWTLLSGVAELVTAGALAVPATRRLGGGLAAALFVAVFPANVEMARKYVRSSRTSPVSKAIAVVRLPLQIPLVTTALAIRRAAGVAGRPENR